MIIFQNKLYNKLIDYIPYIVITNQIITEITFANVDNSDVLGRLSSSTPDSNA